jgi:hypothetical protein
MKVEDRARPRPPQPSTIFRVTSSDYHVCPSLNSPQKSRNRGQIVSWTWRCLRKEGSYAKRDSWEGAPWAVEGPALPVVLQSNGAGAQKAQEDLGGADLELRTPRGGRKAGGGARQAYNFPASIWQSGAPLGGVPSGVDDQAC